MYHRQSRGGISYAEFRHLGKEGVLGKYAIHFHLVRDTMRGSGVIGASIWDSHNRWITLHGTDCLLIRDCVGYQSKGHGFFLEDGTETYNILDHNLAVQAYITKPLPKQVMPFDNNDGSGFWWANSLNSFTRNVAAECDEYGYFFQAAKTPQFDLALSVLQPDGSRKKTDIRTLPFIQFEDNEAHCQRRHAFNLGGGVPFGEPNVAGVGPDEHHPFIIRHFKVWNSHWAIHPVSPSVLLDGLSIFNTEYGVWRPVYKQHAYEKIRMKSVPEKTAFAFDDANARPKESDFPKPLTPVDDLPPMTMITSHRRAQGKIFVRGVAEDNGEIVSVTVNGVAAKINSQRAGIVDWEITVEAPRDGVLTVRANDKAGNVEKIPHVVKVN